MSATGTGALPVPANNLVEAASQQKRVFFVNMNDIGMTFFNGLSPYSAIATVGLGSCTVVTIISPMAAILMHYSPRPPTADVNDLDAGDNFARLAVATIKDMFFKFVEFFPGPDSFTILARSREGEVGVPDQEAIIHRGLEQIGIITRSAYYEVEFVDPRDRATENQPPPNPAKGTVLVDSLGRYGKMPTVYVEDRPINYAEPPGAREILEHTTALTATLPSAVQSPAAGSRPIMSYPPQVFVPMGADQGPPTSVGWIWEGPENRYYRLWTDGSVEWGPVQGQQH